MIDEDYEPQETKSPRTSSVDDDEMIPVSYAPQIFVINGDSSSVSAPNGPGNAESTIHHAGHRGQQFKYDDLSDKIRDVLVNQNLDLAVIEAANLIKTLNLADQTRHRLGKLLIGLR
jgi:hypothetical protein